MTIMKYKKSFECSLELLINGVAGDKIPKGMQKDALTIQKNTQKWLLSNGLQAMGIAKRTVAGQEQEETVLKAYIEKKLPKSQIREGLIPKYLEIPSSNSRLPIDVETIGKLRIQNNLNDHHRPLFPGLSIIRDGFDSGRLGCLVRRRSDPENVYILSNEHILGDQSARTGKEIYQPDVVIPANSIAKFSESVGLKFDAGDFQNLCDAAIAKLQPGIPLLPLIANQQMIAGVSSHVKVGMPVKVFGNTNDASEGVIKDINFAPKLEYKNHQGNIVFAHFKNQVLCTRFTSPGDSGSLVLNKNNNKAIGLHFAGSDTHGTSIFSPIGVILNSLGITLIRAPNELPSQAMFDAIRDAIARWTKVLEQAETIGASLKTAEQDGLPAGIDSSRKMAKTDLGRVLSLRDKFETVSKESDIPVALLVALASRESRVGHMLKPDGTGDDGHAFGIMQIDFRYHTVLGRNDPASLAHIRQAASILNEYRDKVHQKHPQWSDEHILKGAIVAYNSGVKNVQTIYGMDIGTTGDDYGSDVIARAQFYLEKL